MAFADREWIGKELFETKGKIVATTKLWWHPSPVEHGSSQPMPEHYSRKRLFLWMPRKMWRVDFQCSRCQVSLKSKGPYNRVRLVLDVKDSYYLAAEYMSCDKCKGSFIAWDCRMLDQLSDGVRARFPVVLTYKYACDQAVVSLLKARTFGNSPSALCNNLQEVHSEEWLRRQLSYLCDCARHKRGIEQLGLTVPDYSEFPPFPKFPNPKWFLAVYLRDVWSRLPSLLAKVTSTYGSVLKIDSTKKICKKLQGNAANSVNWVTSVGNERGEVVISVLTTSESSTALKKMADGLVERYEKAGQEQPKVLYTDRDCCSIRGMSKYKLLFEKWAGALHVRLDSWHFMRRLARGVTSEAHPLHGEFMARLSNAIFEWDKDDVAHLKEAKRGEMVKAGIPRPTEVAIRKAITKEELIRHCRRRTKGFDKTIGAVDSLISSLSSETDTLSDDYSLFKAEMKDVWAEQRHHIACLQDPPEIHLYTITHHIEKGGIQLPVYRCARGTTSLESFHLHLARFIPGTSASAVNFQAFLLDGITRWNSSRTASAIGAPKGSLRTFHARIQEKINALSQSIHQKDIFPLYRPPSRYTGELFGVEYLYDQSGMTLQTSGADLDKKIEEGLRDVEDEDIVNTAVSDLEDMSIAFLPSTEVSLPRSWYKCCIDNVLSYLG